MNKSDCDRLEIERKSYCHKVMNGFKMPVVSVVAKTNAPCDTSFDSICNTMREAFAGCITYLKQFKYTTGYEGYFVVDMQPDKIYSVLERLRAENTCCGLFNIEVSIP